MNELKLLERKYEIAIKRCAQWYIRAMSSNQSQKIIEKEIKEEIEELIKEEDELND